MLIGGSVLSLAYLLLPTSLPVLRDLVLYPIVEFGAAAGILIGVHTFRPQAPGAWRLIAAGIVAFGIGDLVWGIDQAFGNGLPSVSVADFWYLAGYPLIGAGLVFAVQRRSRGSQRAVTLDSLGIVAAGMLLIWVYLLQPTLADETLTAGAKLVAAAYPVGDLILLAVTLRLAFGDGLRSPSLRLLVLGLGFQFLADIVYTGNGRQDTLSASAFYLAGLVSIGTAALMPSMRDLTAKHAEQSWVPTRRTVAALGAATLVPYLVLIIEWTRGKSLPIPAVAISGTAILVLMMLRVSGLILDSKRALLYEKTFDDYSAALLERVGEGDLVDVADETASRLVSPGHAGAVALPADGAVHAVSVPVMVEGSAVAALFADVEDTQVEQVERQLMTVAAQLSLAMTRERLIRREQHAAAALLEQNERLRELDDLKNRFVSSASHELRTPLSAIIGYLEIVLGGEIGGLNDEQEEFLQIVKRNCDRLNKLVDDILFMGRVDSDRLTLEPQEVDLVALAAAEVESMHAAAQSKNLTLLLEAPEPVGMIEGDPTRLMQVLDNLLSNAVKFCSPGGSVTVAVHGDEDAVALAVQDTGVGIPADELPRIFERFFRASTAATSGAPGTGIGLSIVQAIAEAHGGQVDVRSELGTGTTFTVTLPRRPSPDAAIAMAAQEHATAAAG